MADTLDEAKSEAREDARSPFVLLAEKLGGSAGADAVFGTPVERDGVTVIPVARVRWGIGGGTGRRKDEDREGFGGGGGVQAAPLGYIELSGGAATYRRIMDPIRWAVAAALLPVTMAAAGVVLILTLTALARSLKQIVTINIPELPWFIRGRRS